MEMVQVCDSLWGVTLPAPALGQDPAPGHLLGWLFIQPGWGRRGEGSRHPGGGEGEVSPEGGRSREKEAPL